MILQYLNLLLQGVCATIFNDHCTFTLTYMSRFLHKISAVFGLRCPRCEQGKMFSHRGLEFARFLDMPEKCPTCGLMFTPEPGFYMGSMFVSYGLFSWGMLGLVALFYMVFHIGINMSIFLAVLSGLISFTFVIRLSRAIALHLARSYDPIHGKKGK